MQNVNVRNCDNIMILIVLKTGHNDEVEKKEENLPIRKLTSNAVTHP